MSLAATIETMRSKHLPARRERLFDVARDIHAQPEIRFEERHAAARLVAELRESGFDTIAGYAGLETAFVGRWSTPGATEDAPRIAIFCEYDALEGIGHGCGHNIIAASGLGAAQMVKDVLAGGEDVPAHLMVVGSPAEEGAAGKVPLIEAGLLEGVDVAMMTHPAGFNEAHFESMARVALDVTFHGRASHAAGSPEDGINALDASTLSLTAIGLLRQQIKDGARIHAIVTDGGQAPNIIPERSALRVFVRSGDSIYLREELVPRVQRCFEGAAIATGCQVEQVQNTPAYLTMETPAVLADLTLEGFAALGREAASGPGFSGSTDMGNVSHVVPAMHPMLELVPGIANHTVEFAAAAVGDAAERVIEDGALLLAASALELIRRPELREQAQRDFEVRLSQSQE